MIESKEIKYGSWINRLLAYIVDFVIIMAFLMPMNYFNIIGPKNFLWYLAAILISISYKPLLEFLYGKTIGKHLFRLSVCDKQFKRIGVLKAYIRNSILIMPSLVSVPFYYIAFNDPTLIEINNFKNFAEVMAIKYPLQNTLSTIMSLIILVDVVFVFFDKKKRNRTLHDIVAETLVLQSKK